MKISPIAFLLCASPFVGAETGLKGSARKLQSDDVPPVPRSPPSTYSNSPAGRQDITPTLEQLNEIYGAFCGICSFTDIAEQLLGLDVVFCDICDVLPEIPTELPEIPDFSGLCFSEVSTVQVENIGPVTMKDLTLGSQILTQSGKFEPVYAWGHKDSNKKAEFLQFQTQESTLEMTGGHLVFLEGKKNPVRADSIKVGDVLQGANGKVDKISTITREGVYTPLTPSGTVVVDGIVASSYISLQKDAIEFGQFQGGYSTHLSFQDFIHMALSPFRMLCMGISSSLGNVYTEEGIPLYASALMDLAKWADQQNIVVQFVLLLIVGSLAGASMFVENTFGAAFGPLAVLTGGAAYAMMKRQNIVVRKVKSV